MDTVELLNEARRAGLEVRADGTTLVVRGPRSEEELAQRLLGRKASVLCALVLPKEVRPLIDWARYVAERRLTEDLRVRFNETALRPICLAVPDVSRYVSERLGSLSLLQSWHAADPLDKKAEWRIKRIEELCSGLEALKEALRPLGLAHVQGGHR